jgi:hypothetical protein
MCSQRIKSVTSLVEGILFLCLFQETRLEILKIILPLTMCSQRIQGAASGEEGLLFLHLLHETRLEYLDFIFHQGTSLAHHILTPSEKCLFTKCFPQSSSLQDLDVPHCIHIVTGEGSILQVDSTLK